MWCKCFLVCFFSVFWRDSSKSCHWWSWSVVFFQSGIHTEMLDGGRVRAPLHGGRARATLLHCLQRNRRPRGVHRCRRARDDGRQRRESEFQSCRGVRRRGPRPLGGRRFQRWTRVYCQEATVFSAEFQQYSAEYVGGKSRQFRPDHAHGIAPAHQGNIRQHQKGIFAQLLQQQSQLHLISRNFSPLHADLPLHFGIKKFIENFRIFGFLHFLKHFPQLTCSDCNFFCYICRVCSQHLFCPIFMCCVIRPLFGLFLNKIKFFGTDLQFSKQLNKCWLGKEYISYIKSINQSIDQSITGSINQSINGSLDQSINQSINGSLDQQSIDRPIFNH